MPDIDEIEDVLEDGFEELLAKLRRQRDELRVQLHLASLETKEEWEVLEGKWAHLNSKLKQITDEVKHSGREVGHSLGQIGREIESGYQKIRKLL